MIPSTTGYLDEDFEIEEKSTKAYKMYFNRKTVNGFCDELEAVKQAVFRILQTERYAYIIYPWYYGIETIDLYGMPVTYVCPELERRIKEALLMDDRITNVNNFEFDLSKKGVVHTSFNVVTVYGDFEAESEVTT